MDLQSKPRSMPWLSRGSCCFRRFQQPEPGTFFTQHKGKINSARSASLAFPELGAGASGEAPRVSLGLGPERAGARGRDARGGSGSTGARGSVSSGFGTRLCRGFHSNLHLHLASGHSYDSLRTQAEPELRRACGVVGAAVAEAAGAGEGPARRGGGAGAGAGWVRAPRLGGGAAPRGPRLSGTRSLPATIQPGGLGTRSGRVVKGNANRTPGHFGHSWGPHSTSILCEELLLDLDNFGLSCLQSLDQKFHEGIF